MLKNLSLIPVALIASTMAFAGPQGFENKTQSTNQSVSNIAPTNGVQGFNNTSTLNPTKIADINKSAIDDQIVLVRGRITGFRGDDKYDFADETGSLVLELDDDKSWSHIAKDQLIEVVGEAERHLDYTIIEVKSATPIER